MRVRDDAGHQHADFLFVDAVAGDLAHDRAAEHHKDAVGERDQLVELDGDHEDGLAGLALPHDFGMDRFLRADVDALLVERHGLIGNLVAVVRAFAEREHDVIRDVLDARIDAVEAMGDAAIHTDTQIANVLQNLFSVSENYPTLVSAGHYSRLRDDLIRVEDRITAARKFYNLAVEELNAVRRAFPGNLLARRAAPVREKFSLGERRAEMAESRQISF